VILNNRNVLSLRALAVVLAAALAPAIAGCEAGFNAPTQRWHPPTAGGSATAGSTIRINNVFVLGAPTDSALQRGGSAGLFLAMNNSGAPDRLTGITAPGTAATVQLPGGSVRLPTEQTVLLTGPAPQVVLRSLTRPLDGGSYIRLVLHFLRAGNVLMQVPVMPRAQWFSTFSPAPVPASPSPSTSASGGSQQPTPTPSPS
jgi:hypothetical protein